MLDSNQSIDYAGWFMASTLYTVPAKKVQHITLRFGLWFEMLIYFYYSILHALFTSIWLDCLFIP